VSAVAPGAGIPTGTATFKEGTTALGTGTLSGGVAIFATRALGAGTHSITASYGGDASFLTSATATPIMQTVTKAPTTTALTSSAATPSYGQPITFTATVSSAAGTPIGTLTFADGATVLGASMLLGGIATFTTSSLDAGTHTISAAYGGGDNYLVSASVPLTQIVIKAATTTTLTSNAASPTFGQPLTFTATVRSPGGTPIGTVTFADGTTVLGTGTLAAGVATFTLDTLAAGSHGITATYSGSGNFFASATATPLVQTITKAPTALDLTYDTSLIEEDNWVALAVTARPAALAGSTLSGTVEFIVIAPDGQITRTVASLGVSGIARSRQRFEQQPGSYSFSVVFTSTNPNFKDSTGGPVTITVGPGTQGAWRGGPVQD
jgi:uncharacterized repeat protein (TIGR01451 family)